MSYIIDILPSPFFTAKSTPQKRDKLDDLQELEEIVLCEKNHTAININIDDRYFSNKEANNVSQTILSFLQENNKKKEEDIDLLDFDFDEIDSLLNYMTIEELDEMIKKCEEIIETI
jgi:hypothetical protein